MSDLSPLVSFIEYVEKRPLNEYQKFIAKLAFTVQQRVKEARDNEAFEDWDFDKLIRLTTEGARS